jgi:hypothetical protein
LQQREILAARAAQSAHGGIHFGQRRHAGGDDEVAPGTRRVTEEVRLDQMDAREFQRLHT